MPIYEYQCVKCHKVHEVMQKFSDAPLDACPECQGKVTKLMSLNSFALKGTGWYSTDYKRKPAQAQASEKGEAGKTEPGSPDKEKSSAVSGESKPDTKADSKATPVTSSSPVSSGSSAPSAGSSAPAPSTGSSSGAKN